MKWKRYSQYKNSGIEWLGEIPEGWDSIRLKYLSKQIIDGTHFTPNYVEEGVPFLRVTDIHTGTIDFCQVKRITREEHEILIKRCKPEKGDLLLSKNGTIGVPCIVNWSEEFSIFVSLCLIKVKKSLNVSYAKYIFLSNEISEQIYAGGKKNTITNLHLDKIKEFFFSLPLKEEQRDIAAFLDRETSRIDKLIEKKEKQIELLKEKRAALISHAVTKGLDPNVKMKDSGIDWLGEIPEDWRVMKLKYIASVKFSNVDKKITEDQQQVRLCNYIDVYYNDIITTDLELMTASASTEEIAKFSLKEGDVLITKDSESWEDIAVPAFVSMDLEGVVCGYHLAQVRPKTSLVDGKYLFRAFCFHGINYQYRVEATGITRYGLGKYWLDNSLFIIPPKEEQQAIATFLDRETIKIDALIEKVQKSIELLKEYRTAIISAAVTGKIDVRGIV